MRRIYRTRLGEIHVAARSEESSYRLVKFILSACRKNGGAIRDNEMLFRYLASRHVALNASAKRKIASTR